MVGVTFPVHAAEYEDARKLISAQRWGEALPLLKVLYDEDPDSVVIAQDLSQSFLRLNRREEALEILRKHKLTRQADIAAKSFLSKESFRFYQQGLDWLTKRAFSQACERFEKALEKDQAHSEILYRQIQCAILDGNPELTLKVLDNFERIHGKNPETILWRARALALRGRFEEAIVLFSMNTNGKLPDVLAELNTLWWGEALLASGQKSQALTMFENDAKRFSNHLQTTLALLKLRFASAESPNQFSAIDQELTSWEKQFAKRQKEKKPRLGDLNFEPSDIDALQRSAGELKAQVKAQLPPPRPTSAPRPVPSIR